MYRLFLMMGSTMLSVIFAVNASHAQNDQKKATLTLQIKNCRKGKNEYLNELLLIKNKQEIKKLNPQHNNIQTIADLDTGTYLIRYETIFQKMEELKIVISDTKTYSIDICIDYLDYAREKYIPVIDQLQDHEKMFISISSTGCFHWITDSLEILRNGNSYQLKWGNRTRVLNDEDLINFHNFETELNYMSTKGCTTRDTYTIRYNQSIKKIEDGSCEWDGWWYLKEKLFGKASTQYRY